MTNSTNWMRNYGAMGDPKLRSALNDFQRGYGDAVNRVEQRGGSVVDNRAKCEYEARKRGMLQGDSFVPTDGTDAITEPKFCPECERKKAFLLDDYICRDCRKKMEGEIEIAPEGSTSKEDLLASNNKAVVQDAEDALAKALGNL